MADEGELEIEFQPAGVRRDSEQKTLVAPATVLNFGLKNQWELVLEGQLETPLSPSGPSVLTASGAFLKHVLREGVLQDKSGPSIATEFGLLMPDSDGSNRLGASLAGIVSQRFDWGTVHLNGEAALTRDHNADVFLGAIVEGPSTWKVRPVAEVFSRTRSASPARCPAWSARSGRSTTSSASTSASARRSPPAIR